MWCSCRCNGIILREIHSHGAKRQVKVLLRCTENQKVKVMVCELYSCTYAFPEF